MLLGVDLMIYVAHVIKIVFDVVILFFAFGFPEETIISKSMFFENFMRPMKDTS